MLALALMIAQAFLFNAVFFSYALVLVRFQGVPGEGTGLHLVTLAASNFLSPLLLGHFFDTIGRRVMITATYAIGGVLLVPFGGGELHDPVLHRAAGVAACDLPFTVSAVTGKTIADLDGADNAARRAEHCRGVVLNRAFMRAAAQLGAGHLRLLAKTEPAVGTGGRGASAGVMAFFENNQRKS